MNGWIIGFGALASMASVMLFLWLKEKRQHELLANKYAEKDVLWLTEKRDHELLVNKYAGIISLEEEASKLSQNLASISQITEEARSTYKEKRAILARLEEQIAIYDDTLSFAEFGVYEPQFSFNDGELFKERIALIRKEQKDLILKGLATICGATVTIGDSLSKGQTAVKRQEKLSLRAFNSECEAAIANTKWNNVNAMEKRIKSAAEQINKANKSMMLSIAEPYVQLKIDELRVTHEYREYKKQERDRLAELRSNERQEERLRKEIYDTELEERRWQSKLNEVRASAGADTDTKLSQRIEELEQLLAEAHERTERAKSMAELTSTGFVYVISNVGSFGEGVVKIGVTRRLDPDDRIRELGDASVPFTFDTHAMIYSGEALKLEASLHSEFHAHRVNLSNMRKEFFRVSLDSVEEAVKRLAPDAAFIKDREAQQWQETIFRRNQILDAEQTKREAEFPLSI